MKNGPKVALCLAAFLQLSNTSGIAQDEATELRLELAISVLTGFPFGGDERPEITPGRLPRDLASALHLPASARVVGTVSYSTHSFSEVSFGELAPDLEAWAAVLEANGWSRERSQESPGFQLGPIRADIKLCQGDSLAVTLGPTMSPAGERLVHIFELREAYAGCGTQTRLSGARVQSPIPRLTPPAGSTALTTSGGGGGTDWYSRTALRSGLSVAELLNYYGDRLSDVGWRIGSTAATSAVAVAPLELDDATGQHWYGSLTVGADGDTTGRSVTIAIARATGR